MYDDRGNQKSLAQVNFGSKFLTESSALLQRNELNADSILNSKQRCLRILIECIIQVAKWLPEQKTCSLSSLAWVRIQFSVKPEEWISSSNHFTTWWGKTVIKLSKSTCNWCVYVGNKNPLRQNSSRWQSFLSRGSQICSPIHSCWEKIAASSDYVLVCLSLPSSNDMDERL